MKKLFLSFLLLLPASYAAKAQQAENLGRGVVAVKTDDGVFLSWRSLVTDDDAQGFNVYRDGTKVNEEPITKVTNYTDTEGNVGAKYVIKSVVDGTETETSTETEVWDTFYKKLHLDRPAGGITPPYTVKNSGTTESYPDGQEYDYSPNDCSVGDLDGDGEYEIIVKWDPSNSRDNSQYGYTGNVYLDAYKLDGTKLWRIDLGRNIRAGAHYTQFMVYDLDGDGKAEVACKTAPGTIDGQGKAVLMGNDKETDDYRSSGSKAGIVTSGSEYLTVFNGLTGAEITTTSYVPLRSVTSSWGDSYGNRSERYLACIAYLDGQKPSLVMCRGYYTQSYLCAWDFDGTTLTQRWLHKSEKSGQGIYGEGSHSLAVGDVDGDGCDEIVYGSACVDHDGTTLYRTGAGHGDALHLGDLDPDREGLEVFMVHEEKKSPYKWDATFRDAKTGEIIWGLEQTGNDIGRGLAADISDTYRGYECWPIGDYTSGTRVNNVFDCKGNAVSTKRPSVNFRVYWDGDLQDEILDGATITKPNETLTSNNTLAALANYSHATSCNSTKSTPNLSADILGDWREEVILHDGNTNEDLLIFTTTIPTSYKVPCLMQDHIYRMAIAWQNVAYNQPPHLGYYLPDVYSTAASFRSVSGSLNQTIEEGESIEPVTYTWKNADGVEVTGLPDGVTMTVDNDEKSFTISGTPTASGTYSYKVSSVGGETTATLEGKINVREKVILTEIAYFPFDEAGATTENKVYGSATTVGTVELTEGPKDKAIVLADGAYLKQDAYESIQMGTRDFTIEMWFKSTATSGYLFHKGSNTKNTSTGASGKWIGLELKNGNLSFSIDDDATKSTATVTGAAGYFNGNWNHLVCVRDSYSKSLLMYLNGVLVAETGDNTGDISDNNELMVIGNVNVGFDTPFAGAFDELHIYEGAMSASTVKTHYNELVANGINSISDTSVSRLTLYSATTGMVVARGAGSPENVVGPAVPGVYILVTDNGKTRTVRKFVKK